MIGTVWVNQFTRVLFQMGTRNAHFDRIAIERKLDLAATDDRFVKLRYLVTLGQVGVKVILAIKFGFGSNFTVKR